jgi:hypothetical protein
MSFISMLQARAKNKKISNCSLSVHGVDHGVGNIITFQEAKGFDN